jgi:tripartite-type tricarboxylate transporter receptor subunit TctC
MATCPVRMLAKFMHEKSMFNFIWGRSAMQYQQKYQTGAGKMWRYPWVAAIALLLLSAGGAAPQTIEQVFPTRTIRVIVPVSAGSATDIIARTIANQLSQQLGQSVIVENRVGGGGTIGAAVVAKADPDGYTLLVHSTSFAVSATVYSNPGYDARKDFAGITSLVSLPNVLVVAPDKYKTLKDLVAAAKANPGKLNYASPGPGTAGHLNGERFRMATGTNIQHVPYRGGPEGLTAVMTGDCDFYFVPLPAARGMVAAGKLAVLAVSGSVRASALPEVPTTIESGFPNSEYNFWIGFFAPAATPKSIIDKLNAETVKALQNPDVRAKLAELGGDPLPMTSAAFNEFFLKEIDVNAELVKAAGVTIN